MHTHHTNTIWPAHSINFFWVYFCTPVYTREGYPRGVREPQNILNIILATGAPRISNKECCKTPRLFYVGYPIVPNGRILQDTDQ